MAPSIRPVRPVSLDDLLALAVDLDSGEEPGLLYLARDLLKVKDRAGFEQPLEANAAQQAFERRRGSNNIILKARQMGMTTWVAGRFFLKTITTRGTMTVQVAQTREAAEGIFRIAQRFWECLPEELRTGPLKRSRSNIRQMVFPALDSEFRVVSAADRNAGRGLTIHNLHCSELSRWPGNPGDTLAGLRAALVPGGELVLESTPFGAQGCFYNEWQQATQSGLVRHFFPWWMEPAYVATPVYDFTDDEQKLVQAHGVSPAQIGFRRTLEGGFRGLMSQEYAEDAERCFRATGVCCFEIGAIEDRMSELGAPYREAYHRTLHYFLPAQEGRRYLLAVDTAGGGPDGDHSVLQVIDRDSGLQCAELQRKIKPMELAHQVALLAREYNQALVIVERNNHGHGVISMLLLVERYEHIYRQQSGDGWLTTSVSRPRMIGLLGALLVEQPMLFHSRRLLAECRTFVDLANGSTGAAAGAHDDCVMAMAIAQQVRSDLLQGIKA